MTRLKVGYCGSKKNASMSGKSRSYYSSLFSYRCPRCREGKLFTEPFQFSSPLDMHARCSRCNLKFTPEPGYYWGAMFLSYMLSAFPLMGIVLFCMFGMEYSVVSSLLIGMLIAGLLYFKLMRFSRSLWIHLMIGFDPKAAEDFSLRT